MFKWKDARRDLPNKDLYRVLMCKIYVHNPTDPDIEHFYKIGHYSNLKGFITQDGLYNPDYYAEFEEPNLYKDMTTGELIEDGKQFIAEMEQELKEFKNGR